MSAAKNFSVSISYPPLSSAKGSPFLSQNRQFQWTHTDNIIYPVIPASAATLLSQNGYTVFWDDAIAEKLNYSAWLSRLLENNPSLIAIETKTPVIKKHWHLITEIKKLLPQAVIVLMGDHVTALPTESLKKCPVDFVITGGDYDFMLLNLCRHLTHGKKLEPGFYFKKNNIITNSGRFSLKHHSLDPLPLIDRQLTKWHLYSVRNSNFKYTPGAYTMFSRDCWWGQCTFCSWTTLYPGKQYRCFSPNRAVAEIENLVNNFKVKEIFDDSGTFPVGEWLENFCHLIIQKKLHQKVTISCNMRFGVLNQSQYQLMAQAGFRMLLYGFESANQKTLDKINKNNRVGNALQDLTMAKKANLFPHLTAMIGYPWETQNDTYQTFEVVKNFFRRGLADSIQATIVIPYPGTPLFNYCRRNKLLKTTDWDKYDMSQPVIKSRLSSTNQKKLIQQLFNGIITPKFLFNQIIHIRSFEDVQHLFRYTIKFFKKLNDFS
ncbi:MAG: radical SAM protein [Candidatus Shapirobacteria bacterium]